MRLNIMHDKDYIITLADGFVINAHSNDTTLYTITQGAHDALAKNGNTRTVKIVEANEDKENDTTTEQILNNIEVSRNVIESDGQVSFCLYDMPEQERINRSMDARVSYLEMMGEM